MRPRASRHRDKRRLKLWLALFFLALAIPAGILVRHAYNQLKSEAFHRHRLMAEEFTKRIDHRFAALIGDEQARRFEDYGFLVVSGDPAAKFLQRSVLSAYPVDSRIPGLIGYFQIDDQGGFTTPLLPQPGVSTAAYGVSAPERRQREALAQRILKALNVSQVVQNEVSKDTGDLTGSASTQRRNQDKPALQKAASDLEQIPSAATAPEPASKVAQTAFDRLTQAPAERESSQQRVGTLGRVEDLKLDADLQHSPAAAQSEVPKSVELRDKRGLHEERSAVYGEATRSDESGSEARWRPGDVRITMFEGKPAAFEFALLDSGHFVLFRKVWRDGRRYVQGALIEPKAFLDGIIATDFHQTALSRAASLAVAYRGDVFTAYSGQASRGYVSSTDELEGTLLYRTYLSTPLDALELVFGITHLPVGPGGAVVTWVAAVLLLVLCGGLILMYRLGAKQIDLTHQQQDFVSAVSHELKTPLTAIRMYGEMLRTGWADEAKKRTYYNYIFDESERLSRLIENILQLARMTRNDIKLDLKPASVGELLDGIRAKIVSVAEKAGFDLRLSVSDDAARSVVHIDRDAFAQIVINLVDNAIKFSARAEDKRIDIICGRSGEGSIRFRIRDYGPGVARDQMKKIFKLFYRSENELTRDTVGTGIGLALVNQLTLAMGGAVDVVNHEPGAEFVIAFPAREPARSGDQ